MPSLQVREQQGVVTSMNNPTATQQIRDLQRLIAEVQKSLEQLQKSLDATQGNERPKYKLIVTMPDGKKIQKKKASDTFVIVIEKIGIERVRGMNIIAVGTSRNRSIPLPLIAPYKDTHPQRKSGPYFIAMGSNTDKKAEWLRDISTHLNLKIKVEVKEVKRAEV